MTENSIFYANYSFGLFLDLLQNFEIKMDPERFEDNRWESGKEAADWVASNLKEFGRLKL